MVDAKCELAKIYRFLDRKVCHDTGASPDEVALHSEIRDYFTEIAHKEASRIVSSRGQVAILRRFLKDAHERSTSPAGYLFDLKDGGHWFTDNHLAVITHADLSKYKQAKSYSGAIPDVYHIFHSEREYDDFANVSLFNLCAHELVYPVDLENDLAYATHIKLNSNQGKVYGVCRYRLLFLMEFWHVDTLKLYFSTSKNLPALILCPSSTDKAVLGTCRLDSCPTFLSDLL